MARRSIKVKILTEEGVTVPEYIHSGDSGMDIRANNEVKINLKPGEIQVIPTGIRVAIPEGYEIQVRSRSGLSAKLGIIVLNAPGTIDAGYRGEIKVILKNTHPSKGFMVTKGMRIAQLVLVKVPKIKWKEVKTVEALDKTSRGKKGLGSTGIKKPKTSKPIEPKTEESKETKEAKEVKTEEPEDSKLLEYNAPINIT